VRGVVSAFIRESQLFRKQWFADPTAIFQMNLENTGLHQRQTHFWTGLREKFSVSWD
jgi:hypothetical protein